MNSFQSEIALWNTQKGNTEEFQQFSLIEMKL